MLSDTLIFVQPIDWVISINPEFRNDLQIFQPKSNSTATSTSKRIISYAFATQKYQTVWTFSNATIPNGKKVTTNELCWPTLLSTPELYSLFSLKRYVLGYTTCAVPTSIQNKFYCRSFVVSTFVYLLVLFITLAFFIFVQNSSKFISRFVFKTSFVPVCVSLAIII